VILRSERHYWDENLQYYVDIYYKEAVAYCRTKSWEYWECTEEYIDPNQKPVYDSWYEND
jgi:hypothetical protein